VNARQLLLRVTEGILTAAIAGLVFGTTLAFGGAVWWAPTFIAALALLVVAACLVRMLLEGTMRVLKSPLTLLALLALGLGVVQLAPLPAPLATRLSPQAQAVYSRGVLPALVHTDDPEQELPDQAPVRSPATLDRSATLRWLAGGLACLGLFWGVSQFTDRLGRLYVVWGSIIAGFFLNTAFALVQVGCQVGGLFGLFQPGASPFWGPTVDDLLTSPNASILRAVASPAGAPGHPAWATLVPDRPFLFGSLMGGADSYLALGALGMPLALAVTLQLIAPRGSREALGTRLGQAGQGSLVVLLFGLLLASAVLVGLMAGPLASIPFAIGLILVGLPAAWPTGLRWSAVGLTASVLLFLGCGVVLGDVWCRLPDGRPPILPVDLSAARRVWVDALKIIADFPVVGTGLGTFAVAFPFYKSQDAATTSALSSVLQWWVEAGAVGLALLLIAAAWSLFRLPGAVRRVGTADRSLVFGLIGAATSLSLFSVVHWTFELSAVAIAASAWGGTCNRWLAGGTDLFVERG
jgi:O-Antigen ligase